MLQPINAIFELIKELLPDKRDPLIVWLVKLLVTIGLILLVTGLTFTVIRETPLGRSWGINAPAPKPALTTKEFRDINTVIYTYLARMREEVRALRSVYFVVAFDKQGDINFADQNFDRIGVFSFIFPDARYLSFQTFEEVLGRTLAPYAEKILKEKKCVSGKLSMVELERFKQSSPAWLSNRFVLCPTPQTRARNYPYGAVVAFWVDNPTLPNLESEVKASVEFAATNINSYLANREDLKLQEAQEK